MNMLTILLASVVWYVVDGDTVRLEDKSYVRMIAVDAPAHYDRVHQVQCWGPEATAFVKTLIVPGTPVQLIGDGRKLDKYGRPLFYVEAGSVDVGLRLIELGYARYFRGYKHSRDAAYKAAEEKAHRAGLGLWKACAIGNGQCEARTARDLRCSRKALVGAQYCWQHQPQPTK